MRWPCFPAFGVLVAARYPAHMPIIVFQHSESERPGRLGLVLRDHAFRLEIRRLDRGDPIPPDFDDVDGVISLGGPQRVQEGREPWIAREVEYLRAAHERQLPVVGICLGHQLIARALGAEVGPMDKPEVGYVDVDLTPAGQTDTILAGIPWRTPQFQLHHDEVKGVPPGAVLLASSAACSVQAFRAGMRTYAFQYHPEFDREMIRLALADSRDMLIRAGVNAPLIESQSEHRQDLFARAADRLCLNIATYLLPRFATVMR